MPFQLASVMAAGGTQSILDFAFRPSRSPSAVAMPEFSTQRRKGAKVLETVIARPVFQRMKGSN